MDDIDKNSTTYFMTQMTQEEFDEIRKMRNRNQGFETGWSRDERYILNKIRSDRIQKMDYEIKDKHAREN